MEAPIPSSRRPLRAHGASIEGCFVTRLMIARLRRPGAARVNGTTSVTFAAWCAHGIASPVLWWLPCRRHAELAQWRAQRRSFSSLAPRFAIWPTVEPCRHGPRQPPSQTRLAASALLSSSFCHRRGGLPAARLAITSRASQPSLYGSIRFLDLGHRLLVIVVCVVRLLYIYFNFLPIGE